MHRNRLIELTQLSGKSQRIGSKLNEVLKTPLTADPYAQINTLLESFIKNNNQIISMKNQYNKAANPAKQKQITNRVSKAVKQNKKFLTKIQEQIKKINEQQKQNFEKGQKSETVRIAQINQKANQAIQDFKENQQKFSEGVKGTIRRHAKIIQGQISEGQVQSIMRNPEQGQQMLRAKLLDHPSVELQNSVSDIIDKYRQILELEKSMHECLEMMQEMALLVALTGQQLDSIEQTIGQAGDYVDNADKKLVKAKEHHKSAKKKMCCIIMLLIAAIGAVLIPVLITQL